MPRLVNCNQLYRVELCRVIPRISVFKTPKKQSNSKQSLNPNESLIAESILCDIICSLNFFVVSCQKKCGMVITSFKFEYFLNALKRNSNLDFGLQRAVGWCETVKNEE